MKLEEGQIYEGDVSLSGGNGPHRVWIVVAPFGRTHLHSIDDPLDLHCLTLDAAHRSLETGALRLVGTDNAHPVIQLQREKERRQIHDTHLGMSGKTLNAMNELFQDAINSKAPYAQYAAGEILALVNPELCEPNDVACVRQRIENMLSHNPMPEITPTPDGSFLPAQ